MSISFILKSGGGLSGEHAGDMVLFGVLAHGLVRKFRLFAVVCREGRGSPG